MSRVVTGLQGNPVTAHEISNSKRHSFPERNQYDKDKFRTDEDDRRCTY